MDIYEFKRKVEAITYCGKLMSQRKGRDKTEDSPDNDGERDPNQARHEAVSPRDSALYSEADL